MVTKKLPLTVERLGKILAEEFERDQWGDIDPFYFEYPAKKNDHAADDDARGVYEVLERVVARLKEDYL